jgi:hypothetical protein
MTTVPCWARVRGPLAPYAEGFRVELERLGYTPLTAATHVRLLAHLSRWLARAGDDRRTTLSRRRNTAHLEYDHSTSRVELC